MNNKAISVDIILPSRIGDCILSLPALLCLKQLTEKFPEKNFDITIFSTNKLTKIIKALDLFKIKKFTNFEKLRTFINPHDKAVFLYTSTSNLGFFAKETYGINVTGKKIKYKHDMPYLHAGNIEKCLPLSFIETLKTNYNLSLISIAFMGFLLEIGFTAKEITDTFKFDENYLNLQNEICKWTPKINNYVVICMEAAYGKKTDADRRFKEEMYFDTAKHIYEKYGFKSAFIGINKKIKIPKNNYCYDFRKEISFEQIVQLMNNSKAYIGNDTGPLHLTNLMKKKSLCIYARQDSMKNYHPIFKQLNTMSYGFPTIDFIDNFCTKL